MSVRMPAGWAPRTASGLAARLAEEGLTGCVATVWAGGEPALEAAAGERETGSPMPVDAIFQIASMTKPIVSVAVLQLVDEGAIRLEDPVDRWIPELADRRVLLDPTGRLEATRAAAGPIRIADLLTHRAGLGYAFLEEGPIARAYDETVGSVLSTGLDVDAWLAELARLPLLEDPGTRFRYGHATDVLGCLLARIDRTTLGESLRRRVLDPLDMRDTAFAVPVGRRDRLAHIYQVGDDGRRVDLTVAPSTSPRFEAGGGGLYSTAADYLRFARMLLGGGELDGRRLLRPGTVDAMLRNQLPAEVRSLPAIGRADFFERSGFGYGVGVILEGAGPQSPRPGAINWNGIFGTWWRADPDAGIAAVLMMQQSADITSASGPRRTDVLTPAGRLQEWFEGAVYRGVADGEQRVA